MHNCNPNHETERIVDKFGATVYREKVCRHSWHTLLADYFGPGIVPDQGLDHYFGPGIV